MPENTVNLDTVETDRPHFDGGATLRCLKCEKQTSKKGNPMLVFTWEFCTPETITTPKGNTVKLAGRQSTDWIVLTEVGFKKLKPLHKALKLPMSVNIDAPNTKQYIGRAVDVLVKTEATVVKDEQSGEAQLDDDGNPITANNYRLTRFLRGNDEHTVPADNVAF